RLRLQGLRSDPRALMYDLCVEVGERHSPLCELSMQRGGFPKISVLVAKLADAIVHFLQSHRARIPHGSTAVGGETITVDINDVDVHGPQRDALLEDPGAFVDERIYGSLYDLVVADCAPLDARCAGAFLDNLFHLGIRHSSPVVRFVLVPARAGLLAKASHFTQPV